MHCSLPRRHARSHQLVRLRLLHPSSSRRLEPSRGRRRNFSKTFSDRKPQQYVTGRDQATRSAGPAVVDLVQFHSPRLPPAAKLENSLFGSASWRAIDDSVAELNPPGQGPHRLNKHSNKNNHKRKTPPTRRRRSSTAAAAAAAAASSTTSPRPLPASAKSSTWLQGTRLPVFWVGFVLILVSTRVPLA